MMIPQSFSEWCVDSFGYHLTTRGGQRRLRLQLEDEIKRGMFSEQEWRAETRELADASDRLEEASEQMQSIDSAIDRGKMLISHEGDGEDDSSIWNCLDSRFDHSWIPSRAQSGPGLGCYWIPKGRVRLDLTYPARALEVKRFGYTTRKIRATSPPHNLDRSLWRL